jgi:translocation and assembly module TamB
MRAKHAFASLSLIAALGGAGFWLSHSESGLKYVAQLASQASGGRLKIGASNGQLVGPFTIETLSWESPDLKIRIADLRADWQPGALISGKLAISELGIDQFHLVIATSSDASPPPASLRLPVAVDIGKVAISAFDWAGIFTAKLISGRLRSDGEIHRLSEFVARSGNLSLTGEASLGGAAPLPLNFNAKISRQLNEHPLQIAIHGDGPLERFVLATKAEQGVSGEGKATITPFSAQFFADARLVLDGINPADWFTGAPLAQLALEVDLQPAGQGLAGDFAITNRQPGPFDRQRLPLAKLQGQLKGNAAAMRFEQLRANLSGGGTLSGSGSWARHILNLDLQAAKLDASSLVSRLRKTQLQGPLNASLSVDQQTLKAQLSGPRFAFKVDAQHAAGQVIVPLLELSSGDSALNVNGALTLNQALAFTLEGELNRFDPNRFIKAPSALINSNFKGTGKLKPRPQIDAHFEIASSQFAGEPLAGRGDIRLDWPRVQEANLTLNAGTNQLKTQGAFGRPGEQLDIAINAPKLAPYGIDGALVAQLRLAGSLQAPTLNASAEASRLHLPGIAQLSGLKLALNAGGAANAPLALDLAVARIDDAGQVMLARAIQLKASGNNAHHSIQGSAELAGERHLALRLQGGLEEMRWRGELQEASLSGGIEGFKLTAPTALAVAADAWSFGPAQLAGLDLERPWQARLQANADARQLLAELSARGPRLGEIDGKIEAAMSDAWSLNQQAPWLANLKNRGDDLGWLAGLLGDGWKSGGRLSGELKIAGTPAQPISSGRYRGEALMLQIPEQGLHLANGKLDVELSNNLLHVNQFNFDSLLQQPPRALLRSELVDLAALTGRPGRLEIGGEMRVDRNLLGDRAALDVRLERFGVYQRLDEWVLLSGNGRLNWENNTLGIHGKLAVDAGYWQLAATGTPRLSDDVVIKSPAGEKPASPLRQKLDLDISAELGRNFLFHGAGLSSRLVGDVRVRASGRDLPRASGSIRSHDGRFEAYGQQLEIERGILTFQGLIENPALDVRAVRKGLPVEAGVQVGGTAQKPTVKLISDPELPDAEKLTWLVLGHGPEQLSAADAALLLPAAGSILGPDSAGVVKQLKTTFGIDEFGVRQGQLGDNNTRSTRSRVAGGSYDTTASTGNQILSVGKRLSSNALLSYEQTLGEAESIVKLTVNLTREISVIGRAGSDNALDIFYTITLGKPKRGVKIRVEDGDSFQTGRDVPAGSMHPDDAPD